MSYDIQTLDALTQTFERKGTSLFIVTRNGTNILDSFELTNIVAGGPLPAEIDAIAKSRIIALTMGVPTRDVLNTPPTSYDDLSAGYVVNDHWLNKADTKLYKAIRNTLNLAVWQRVPETSPYIVDAIGVTPAVCISARKLIKAYTGPCFRVTRADSATLDVGFVSDGMGGEIADFAAADAFIVGTTGYISIGYDQSGNARHGVQTVAANGFVPSPITLPEMMRGFDAGGYVTSRYLDIPSTLNNVNRTNHTMFVVGAPISSGTPCVMAELLTCSVLSVTSAVLTANAGIGLTSNLPVHTGPCASVYELHCASGTALSLSIDDATYTYAGAITNTTSTGAVLGSNNSHSSRFTGTIHAFVAFATALTASQRTLFKEQAYRAFSIAPQLRNGHTFIGDSLTNGSVLGASLSPFPMLLSKAYYVNRRLYNIGVSGKTAAQMLTNASWTASIAAANVDNICTIWAGTNDAAALVDAPTIVNTLTALVTATKAQGYSKVGVCTGIGRAAVNSVIVNFNIGIRNGIGQDVTIDLGADPSIGEGKQLNTAFFQADGVHLLDSGQSVVKYVFEAAWSGNF